MKKIINSAIYIILGYIIPLIWKPALLTHPKFVLLIILAFLIFQTQPAINLKEGNQSKSQDGYSMFMILGLSLISILVPILDWAYFKEIQSMDTTFCTVLGLLLLLGGIILRIYAIRVLGRFFTATVKIQEEHRLVQEGPYSIIRHPSYTGAFMAIIGNSILLESWIGCTISIIAMLIAYQYRISVEEKALVAKFGLSYQDYQIKTNKLIPFIW